MINDALLERCIVGCWDGRSAWSPLGERLEEGNHRKRPAAECICGKGDRTEASGLDSEAVLGGLGFLSKGGCLFTRKLSIVPVYVSVRANKGDVRSAGVGDGDVQEVVSTIDHTVDVHSLAVGVVVWRDDADAVHGDLHVCSDIRLSQDSTEKVAHVVVSQDSLAAGAARE